MAIKENLETIAVKSILGYVTKDPEKISQSWWNGLIVLIEREH